MEPQTGVRERSVQTNLRDSHQRQPVSGGLLSASVAMALLVAAPGDLAAQATQRDRAATGPAGAPTLAACRLPLPSRGDRDGGLSAIHLERQQGRPFLLTPSLTFRQTYTDNVTLSRDDEESEFISELIPAVSFCRIGPRFRVQTDYQAQLLHYWDDSSRNDVLHTLNADSTTSVIQERLFLDAGATYEQQPITSRGAFSRDNALATRNRADALTLRASPYLLQDFGPVGSSVTRYAYSRTNYNEGVPNVTRHLGSFNLVSPDAADPFSWRASVRSERVRREDIDPRARYFDDAFLELGYLITDRLRVVGRGGYETEPRPDGSQDRFGSSYWDAGLRWEGDRTQIEGRYGRRFFGDTYFGLISHQTARLDLSLSYRETQQISDRFTIGEQTFQIEIDPVTGDPELISLVDIEREIFVRKRTTGSAAYETGRSRVVLRGFHERREFVVAGDSEERYGADAFWRWQWLPRTAVIPRAGWERLEFREGRDDDLWLAQISVAHLLSPQMQAGATLRRQHRSSDDRAAQYTENAVILELTRVF
ncbi:TIGR03016 family PEP-CTERM system-associated outer membrane protein [Methylonatrum kenyense]|uniref:TIGR03016 family PEP-CTERM system-associated outer membrane protein n=1 Tax=Methylonatrum kenyense TaxID=455253 RepID=UPI0020BD60A9|nr:TIGR03016 family PEP-CTERM system-associated outer membrane protein [Methylonatrum kenyense]MCK8516774.1 TIGR03016 family PEP-CTERM system-associated outer membrane protein [Methylonatrum kenyense]